MSTAGERSGHLIALVGTSSVGKTSVAQRLQEELSEPHLVVGLDHFFLMFPYEWNGHPRGPGPGFWYDDVIDADGKPRARIRYGEAGERLLAGMRAAVLAMLDAGNDIILDEMPLDSSIMPAWKRALADRPVFWVHLDAPLATVEAREAGRTKGLHLGNARGHHGLAAVATYDLRVETEGKTPEMVAGEILRALPF